MSDYAQNLIALLKTDSAVTKFAGIKFHEDHVPQLNGITTEPFVWLSQRQETQLDTLDATQGQAPLSMIFDVECAAGNQFKQKELTAAVKAKLQKYRGTFGDTTVQGIFVEDKDNDYIPRSVSGDSGVYVSSLDVQVFP